MAHPEGFEPPTLAISSSKKRFKLRGSITRVRARRCPSLPCGRVFTGLCPTSNSENEMGVREAEMSGSERGTQV